MSRLKTTFDRLKQAGKKGLVPYITAGDPTRESVVALMHALVKNGADVIELGVPFSDPMADGPVIQRSSERALARHVTLHDCLDWVSEFRKTNRTYLIQDADGQIAETHSVSAGLDYPGVGPEHSWLKDTHRAEYVAITDQESLDAFHTCCRIEGIIPALETSHALAYAAKIAPSMPKDKVILVNLSGRGDKDMHTVAQASGINF